MDSICGNAVEVEKKNLYNIFEVGLAGETFDCALLV